MYIHVYIYMYYYSCVCTCTTCVYMYHLYTPCVLTQCSLNTWAQAMQTSLSCEFGRCLGSRRWGVVAQTLCPIVIHIVSFLSVLYIHVQQ